MDTIKLPLSFDKGRVSVLEENTRPYYSQIIAITCRIEKGELPLEITYGVKDSTFLEFRESELRYTIAKFWPEIQLTTIKQEIARDSGSARVIVDFVHER
jgi:hypothetical protein